MNSGEYKLMGLAPYGKPRYVSEIMSELMSLREDGSFTLNMRYFDFLGGLTMTNQRFDELFGGPPRSPESDITQRELDLARSIQIVTEDVVLRMASARVRAHWGAKRVSCWRRRSELRRKRAASSRRTIRALMDSASGR